LVSTLKGLACASLMFFQEIARHGGLRMGGVALRRAGDHAALTMIRRRAAGAAV
jgi:hypothetical protein